MDIFDPTIGHQREPMAWAPRPKKLKGLRVGLVENTKFNSDVLLKKIGARLEKLHGVTVVGMKRKKSSSSSVTDADIADFKTKADFIVAGIGD
jgi:hypothetical protein